MSRPTRRHAFTLIEAVAAVVVLALLIPPTITMLSEAANARGDAIGLARGTALADAVLEHVIADVSSTDPALGFDALADADTYLDDPSDGLSARIAPLTQPYTAAGLSYSVTIGELVDQTGIASGDTAADIYRFVTVRVKIPSTTGPSLTLTNATMVTDLQ